jgi:hypothetical protein
MALLTNQLHLQKFHFQIWALLHKSTKQSKIYEEQTTPLASH